MQYKMMDWPDLGSAIQSKHKYVIERPQRDSCWPGTSVRKYTLNPLDLLAWNAGPATWTATLTPWPPSRKIKHSSILSSDPITPPRTTSTLSAWSSTLALPASALHKALRSRSSPALGPAPSISSKTSSSTIASRCRLCSIPKVPAPSRSMISSWLPSSTLHHPRLLPHPRDDDQLRQLQVNAVSRLCHVLYSSWTDSPCNRRTVNFHFNLRYVPKTIPNDNFRESQRPFRYCYTCNKKRRDTPDGTATATSSKPPARPPTNPPVARPPMQKQIQLVHAILLPKIRPPLPLLQ